MNGKTCHNNHPQKGDARYQSAPKTREIGALLPVHFRHVSSPPRPQPPPGPILVTSPFPPSAKVYQNHPFSRHFFRRGSGRCAPSDTPRPSHRSATGPSLLSRGRLVVSEGHTAPPSCPHLRPVLPSSPRIVRYLVTRALSHLRIPLSPQCHCTHLRDPVPSPLPASLATVTLSSHRESEPISRQIPALSSHVSPPSLQMPLFAAPPIDNSGAMFHICLNFPECVAHLCSDNILIVSNLFVKCCAARPIKTPFAAPLIC